MKQKEADGDVKGQIKQQQEEDLVQLAPDVPERTILSKTLISKVVILVLLSVAFVGQNIYTEFFIKPQKEALSAQISPEKLKSMSPPSWSQKAAQQSFFEQTWDMIEKTYSYIILTAVLTVIYCLLLRANNKALEQQARKQLEQRQQKERKYDEALRNLTTKMQQEQEKQRNRFSNENTQKNKQE